MTKTSAPPLPTGVYDIDYHEGRQSKRQLIYRLQRRTDEVEGALRQYADGPLRTVVDVGTSDGMMLDTLRARRVASHFVGLDRSEALLRARPQAAFSKVCADALGLPLRPGIADAIIATAVIEHVSDPQHMVRECGRVLRPGGIFVLTTPDPMLEAISTQIGLLKDPGHQHTLTLKDLVRLFETNGFEVLKAQKFMFSPIGFPGERFIEPVMRRVGLGFLMANQLVVARKH